MNVFFKRTLNTLLWCDLIYCFKANMLGLCGETLTKKIRLMAFTNLLRQDIAFYDDPRHSTGKLCTRFATDAPNVRYVCSLWVLMKSFYSSSIGFYFCIFYSGSVHWFWSSVPFCKLSYTEKLCRGIAMTS